MKNVHFAIPEIYGETLSYYELLRKLVNKTNELIDNYNTVPDQIAEEVKKLDASKLFSVVLNQLIHSIATDNTKSANAVKVYKKHDLLYATFNETVNLYESLIDFSTGTETELIVGSNIREVNISELFIELRELIDDETQERKQADQLLQTNINNEAFARSQADNKNSAEIATMRNDITGIENKNTEQDNELSTLRTMLSSPYNFKGEVSSISALPASGKINDTYYVQDVKYKVTWTGSSWVQSSLSESDYQTELSEIKGDLSKIIIKDLSWQTSAIIKEDGSAGVEQNYNTSNFVRVYGNEIIEQNPILIDGVKFFCRISEYDKNYNFIRINDGLYYDGKVIIGENTNYIKFSFGKADGSYVMTPLTSNNNFIAYLYNVGDRIMEESYTPTINNYKFIDTIGYSQKAMYQNGEYTTEDFSESVVVVNKYTGEKIKLEIGQKYRVSISVGYVVMLCWGNSKRSIVDTQLFDFVADSNQLSMQILKLDGHNLSTTEAYEHCNLKITKVKRKNTSLEYDYVVAASNSSYSDKLRADLVCDGINDEIEINCAVNGCVTEKTSCNVLLLGGTYNIGKTHLVFPSNRSDFTLEKSSMYRSAICIQRNWFGTNYHDGFNTTKIHGVSIPYSVRDNSTATIKLSAEVISSLDENYEHCIFSFSKFGSDNMGWIDWKNIVHYKNLCFDIANASKKIIGIDAVSSSGLMVENCIICSNYRLRETDSFTLDTVPMIEGSIGIRGDCGGDNGMGYSYIKSVFVYGMYEGLAITGEHFVIENCLQHSCHYGFTIGNYPTQPKMEHPITFIGNSVEQCYRMALLNRYGSTEENDAPNTMQTIVYINGSTECTWKNSQGGRTEMLPIKEVIKGAYRGRIESDWSVSYPTIFEDGSGLKMKQILYDGNGIKYSN